MSAGKPTSTSPRAAPASHDYFWERSRYDWSQPGTVTATVIDSNVLVAGSTFELRAAPDPIGGCEVAMTLRRAFKRSAAGRIGSALNHLGRERLFGSMVRRTLKAMERAARTVQTDAAKAVA
jgi:hypothetical protein